MTSPTEKAPIPWAEDPSRCAVEECPNEGTEPKSQRGQTVYVCPTHSATGGQS